MRQNGFLNSVQKTMHRKSLSIFLGGIILGIVFFFLWKDTILVNSAKILGELLTWKQYTEIKRASYLLFIVQYRAKDIILFLLFTGIWSRQTASRIFLLGMGIQFGILACVGVALYGVLGILFTLCVHFPQGICYVIAVVLMGRSGERAIYGKYDCDKISESKQTSRLQRSVILCSGMFTIMGVFFEVYVNLKIFFKFLNILKIL